MRLLFLAPQPFFQERGTPIAVRLALEVLVQREPQIDIDLLVYHEGAEIDLPGVTIHRISVPRLLHPFLNGVRPGITLKKLCCDLFFFIHAIRLIVASRKEGKGRYHLIHAVEESVFLALLARYLWGLPYLYDMDSSLSLQLTDTWRGLRLFRPLFSALERMAVRKSAAVVPVCDALAAVAEEAGSPHTCILRDVSLLDHPSYQGDCREPIRAAVGISENSTVILYVGNLERYQGIDLAIESFGRVAERQVDAHLVIVGGAPEHLETYRELIKVHPSGSRMHLLGPRPVGQLHRLIAEADIVISPRMVGNNTPMKVYSYLHSGKPLVATAISSHTQVLSSEVARLCAPRADDFAEGLLWVMTHPEEARAMGERARRLAEERYTFSLFQESLLGLYERFEARTPGPAEHRAPR